MDRRYLSQTAAGALCIFAVAQLTVARELNYVYYEHLWQFTAPAWITGKSLWSAILSMHSQPSGLLTLQWIAANLTPKIIDLSLLFAAAVYVCLSGVIAASVTNSRIVGLLAALLISFQPSTLLYSHWFFSPIYLAAFLAVSLVLILNWARTGNAIWLTWTAFTLAFASLFHAAFLAAFVVFVCLAMLYPQMRRQEIRRPAFVIPLAFATAIAFFAPVKNFVVFGIFSPSSWAPLNLATVYSNEKYIWQKCGAKIRKTDRHPNDYGASKAVDFSGVLNQDMLFRPVKPRGVVNFNHLDVMKCRDDVQLFEQFDAHAATLNVARALFESIALPAWDYKWLGKSNFEKTKNIIRLYELYTLRANHVEYLYYKNIEDRLSNWLPKLPSISSMLLSVLVIFGGVTLLAEFIHYLRQPHENTLDVSARRQLAQAYPGLLALFLFTIFVLANGQELNRVKFGLSPLFLALILEGLRRYIKPDIFDRLRKIRPQT